jgi:hypothetical protein
VLLLTLRQRPAVNGLILMHFDILRGFLQFFSQARSARRENCSFTMTKSDLGSFKRIF